jgi:hypothetical protein
LLAAGSDFFSGVLLLLPFDSLELDFESVPEPELDFESDELPPSSLFDFWPPPLLLPLLLR